MNACWPGRVFQIDGNLAGTAGIAEMLLQSHAGYVHLLPALPVDWSQGSVRGLCARGGFVVDMEWNDGKITKAVIHSKAGGTCKLRYNDKVIELDTVPGTDYAVKVN